MQTRTRKPLHPGRILHKNYIEPLRLNTWFLAEELELLTYDLLQFTAGQRPVTKGLAARLARRFKTTQELWLNLQKDYDEFATTPEPLDQAFLENKWLTGEFFEYHEQEVAVVAREARICSGNPYTDTKPGIKVSFTLKTISTGAIEEVLVEVPLEPKREERAPGEIRFNLNDTVKVRLTDVGRHILELQHYSITNMPYVPPKEDAAGYSLWPLWHLMRCFGEQFALGTDLPFNANVVLEVKS